MTELSVNHRERIDSGLGFVWDKLPTAAHTAADIPPGATDVVLLRIKRSHKGIAGQPQIRRLWAHNVDQAYLDEITPLRDLESLYMTRVTATDLSALRDMPKLQSLSVIDATKLTTLDWLPRTPTLRALALENLKRIESVDALSSLPQLRAVAIEGSMWTPMRIASLQPLAALHALEYVFLTNLRVADKSLEPLHGLKQLKALHCADFYNAAQFRKLALAQPRLRCDWFNKYPAA
ncbi:hypothetical protein [Dyella sp.]|uniref:hypothetical protein n=1 Tax=Dyella sp. TaxID=1869338 RepID=UPI002ED48842